MGNRRPLFVYFRIFKQALQFLKQIYVKNVHPDTMLGFKPTAFRTWVSSYNHWTRAPPKSNFHSFRSKSIDDYFSEFTFGVMPIVLRSLEVGKSLSNDLVTIRLDVSGDLQLVRNVVQSDNKTTTLQNIFQNLLWHTQTKGREVKRWLSK